MIFSNTGVDIGVDADWEDVADRSEEILSLDDAALKTTFWRQ